MQKAKPTRVGMGGQYPRLQRSAQTEQHCRQLCSGEMLIAFTLSVCSPSVHCYLPALRGSFSTHYPIPSPPSENSSSTVSWMLTLHCRKGLQSGGMEGGWGGGQATRNLCIIRRFPYKQPLSNIDRCVKEYAHASISVCPHEAVTCALIFNKLVLW